MQRTASLGDSNLLSAIGSRKMLAQSFRLRRIDTISMSLMPAHGVCICIVIFLVVVGVLTFTIAHRALIVRKLKGLEDIIPFTSVHWLLEEKGSNSKKTTTGISLVNYTNTVMNRMAIRDIVRETSR
jgi:hypothetical protein